MGLFKNIAKEIRAERDPDVIRAQKHLDAYRSPDGKEDAEFNRRNNAVHAALAKARKKNS